MTKILVLQCSSVSGFAYDRIFIGNEFSRDPADIELLIKSQFKCMDWGDGKVHVHNEVQWSDSHHAEVIAVLNRNGYNEVEPTRIFL